MNSCITKTYDLACIYNNQKSFYGKAQVKIRNDVKMLFSYDTEVLKIENNKPKIMIYSLSQTTLKHIKEFLLQEGYRADNKKQIINDYK